MKVTSVRIFILSSILLSSIHAFSQESNRKKIIGTWAVYKIEFLRSNRDSANLINNAKAMIVIFSKDSLTVRMKFDSTFIRTSLYTISPDGSTLTHNGMTATIARLTDEELVLNIQSEGVIEHLKKVH